MAVNGFTSIPGDDVIPRALIAWMKDVVGENEVDFPPLDHLVGFEPRFPYSDANGHTTLFADITDDWIPILRSKDRTALGNDAKFKRSVAGRQCLPAQNQKESENGKSRFPVRICGRPPLSQ